MTTEEYNSATEISQWFGLSSPVFLITVLAIYLLIVFKIGPAYMNKRKAYELKTFIATYNLAQVGICIYIVLKIFHLTSTKVFYFWKCAIFDDNTWQHREFNSLAYFVYWVKIVELTETVVFVLRKKQRQVSKLHVFHHCSTLTLFYLMLGRITGGSPLWPLLLNACVHTIMYLYYLAAAVCDKDVVQRLLPIKKSITTIQMIQFVFILMQAYTFWYYCNMPNLIIAYYAAVVCIIFYGFYGFYHDAYTKRSDNKAHNKNGSGITRTTI